MRKVRRERQVFAAPSSNRWRRWVRTPRTVAFQWRVMARSDTLQSVSFNSVNRRNPFPGVASPPNEPPPWIAASVAKFRRARRLLSVVQPIRAFSFGGILVFAALLILLVGHSPGSQSTLLIAATYGLPICLAAWFVASRAQKRLRWTKNHIESRMHGAGMHVDDRGCVLTDNPHPVLVLDPGSGPTKPRSSSIFSFIIRGYSWLCRNRLYGSTSDLDSRSDDREDAKTFLD
jgi:hypothetical protein